MMLKSRRMTCLTNMIMLETKGVMVEIMVYEIYCLSESEPPINSQLSASSAVQVILANQELSVISD